MTYSKPQAQVINLYGEDIWWLGQETFHMTLTRPRKPTW